MRYVCTEIYDYDVRLPSGEWITRAEYERRTGYPQKKPDWVLFREAMLHPLGTLMGVER